MTAASFATGQITRCPSSKPHSTGRPGPAPRADFRAQSRCATTTGACRKLKGGVMCPSFRATRNERDATRGRANTLRFAISGQLPGGLTSDAMADTMKYCVSCKGCRRECPHRCGYGPHEDRGAGSTAERKRTDIGRQAGGPPASLCPARREIRLGHEPAQQDWTTAPPDRIAHRCLASARYPGLVIQPVP